MVQTFIQNCNSNCTLFQQEKPSVIILDVHVITTETRVLEDTKFAAKQDTVLGEPTNHAATAVKCDWLSRNLPQFPLLE